MEIQQMAHAHVAIEVFAKVYQHHPDARLQILGNQDEQYKQYCQRLTTRLNVTQAVDFIGYQKDIQPILKNSAVMIMTSQFEGFPMVIPEAKAFGIPIVMIGVILNLQKFCIYSYINDN
ncbi:Glycosyl_transferases group 1 family protein [Hexamita inflata]|uniref:Glycosyl transferases group 1 family protein n=1 Tax=Hexamita inflata TaxID=28002 RepID=A0AA86TK11_9EUKA|nr:Glycosyl transferases group 1 family protein [Hexamita inflata]